jgi:hypothetical protein
MFSKIIFKLLVKLVLTNKWLAWKVTVTWARKNNRLIVPRDKYIP